MMTFKDTNLPDDPMVYRAYTIYLDNQKGFPPEHRALNNSLRVAQLLNETTGGDKELIAFALLRSCAESAWVMAERQFGEKIISLKEEIDTLVSAKLAHLAYSTDAAQLYTLASAMTGMVNYINTAKSAEIVLQEGEGVNITPEAGPYEMVLSCIKGQTSAPLLEQRFEETLNELRAARARQMEMLKQQEMHEKLNNLIAPEETAHFPSFEKTGLADYPKVREVYNALAKDPTTRPETFFFAVDVAKVLSTIPAAQSPAAIAAALIKVTTAGNVDPKRWKFAGDDVTAVLGELQHMTDSQTRKMMADMRQITIAIAIIRIDQEQKQAQEMFDIIKLKDVFDAVKSAPSSLVPASKPPRSSRSFDEIRDKELQNLQEYVAKVQLFDMPQPGHRVSPQLEDLFRKKLKDLRAFIELNKSGAPVRRPSPPKPGL